MFKKTGAGTWGWAVVAVLAGGCRSVFQSDLMPPHVRHVACAVQSSASAARSRLSPEYRRWVDNWKLFWEDTKQEFACEYRKNDAWPAPYDQQARRALLVPLDIQAANGRRQLASLWDYHFEPGGTSLTPMGQGRLRDIIAQEQVLGPTVFVQKARSDKETQARVNTVRRELTRLLGQEADRFQLMVSSARPSVVSGAEAEQAVRRMEAPQQPGAGGTAAGQQSASGQLQ